MKEKADFNDHLILFNLDVSYSERLDLRSAVEHRDVYTYLSRIWFLMELLCLFTLEVIFYSWCS